MNDVNFKLALNCIIYREILDGLTGSYEDTVAIQCCYVLLGREVDWTPDMEELDEIKTEANGIVEQGKVVERLLSMLDEVHKAAYLS